MSGDAQLAKLGFNAVIFELDGVVTRTERLHAAAWKKLFDNFLRRRALQGHEPFRPFDSNADYLTYVDGKPRYEGVRSFLTARGIELSDRDGSGIRDALVPLRQNFCPAKIQSIRAVEQWISRPEPKRLRECGLLLQCSNLIPHLWFGA